MGLVIFCKATPLIQFDCWLSSSVVLCCRMADAMLHAFSREGVLSSYVKAFFRPLYHLPSATYGQWTFLTFFLIFSPLTLIVSIAFSKKLKKISEYSQNLTIVSPPALSSNGVCSKCSCCSSSSSCWGGAIAKYKFVSLLKPS